MSELLRPCGCGLGRPCTCDFGERKTEKIGCLQCYECEKNEESLKRHGRWGLRECVYGVTSPAEIGEVEISTYTLKYVKQNVILLPEELEVLSPEFQRLAQHRMIIHEAARVITNKMASIDARRNFMYTELLRCEDPTEVEWDPKHDIVTISSKFVHKFAQRMSADKLREYILPRLKEMDAEWQKEREYRENILAALGRIAGPTLTRIGRGFWGRLRFRRLWRQEQERRAATVIQRHTRGMLGRNYARRRLYEHHSDMAVTIQAGFRGMMGRRVAARRAAYLLYLEQSAAALMFQTVYRGYSTRIRAEEIRRDQELAKLIFERNQAARRKAFEQKCATDIQRCWRGLKGRRAAYNRRMQGYITNPRVRELTDKFLEKGDLWGLLAAVNDDYESRERERMEEIVQAGTFMRQVVKIRELQENKEWQLWNKAKADLPKLKGAGKLSAQSQASSLMEGMGRGFLNQKDPENEGLFMPHESTASLESDIYEVPIPEHEPPQMNLQLRDHGKTPSSKVFWKSKSTRRAATAPAGSTMPAGAAAGGAGGQATAQGSPAGSFTGGGGADGDSDGTPRTPTRSTSGAQHGAPASAGAAPTAVPARLKTSQSFGALGHRPPLSPMGMAAAAGDEFGPVPTVPLTPLQPLSSPLPFGGRPDTGVSAQSGSAGSMLGPLGATSPAVLSLIAAGAATARPPTVEERRAAIVQEDLTMEDTIKAAGFGESSARTLLRDLRGMDGPLDMLILHACLRVARPPPAVLPADDHSVRGEDLARMFYDTPPSLIKAEWERRAREMAAPAVLKLKAIGCNVAGDVIGVNFEKAGIRPAIGDAARRLLRIIENAHYMVNPANVKTSFAQKPSAKKDPTQPRFVVKPGPKTADELAALPGTGFQESIATAAATMSTGEGPMAAVAASPTRKPGSPIQLTPLKRTTPSVLAARRSAAERAANTPQPRASAAGDDSGEDEPPDAVGPSASVSSATSLPQTVQPTDSITSSRSGKPPTRISLEVIVPKPDSWFDDEGRRQAMAVKEAVETLRERLQVMMAIKDLNEGIGPLLLQTAITLPLPTPKLLNMMRSRANFMPLTTKRWRCPGLRAVDDMWRERSTLGSEARAIDVDSLGRTNRDGHGDESVEVLIPYDVFLRELALLPDKSESSLGKQRMLIRERTQVAWSFANCWVKAMHKEGFTQVFKLLGVRADVFTKALDRSEYGPISGVKFDPQLIVPHAFVAVAAISLLEMWLSQNDDTATSLAARLAAFDPRYSRSSTDPVSQGTGGLLESTMGPEWGGLKPQSTRLSRPFTPSSTMSTQRPSSRGSRRPSSRHSARPSSRGTGARPSSRGTDRRPTSRGSARGSTPVGGDERPTSRQSARSRKSAGSRVSKRSGGLTTVATDLSVEEEWARERALRLALLRSGDDDEYDPGGKAVDDEYARHMEVRRRVDVGLERPYEVQFGKEAQSVAFARRQTVNMYKRSRWLQEEAAKESRKKLASSKRRGKRRAR